MTTQPKNILIPSETLLSASQILSTCLVPGHAGGKRVRSQVQARIIRAAKTLQLLPEHFSTGFVGLVLDKLGHQYVIFVNEDFNNQLDSLSAVNAAVAKARPEIVDTTQRKPPF